MPYSWIENVQSNLERLQDLKEEMQRIPGKVFETILEAVEQLVSLEQSRQAVPNTAADPEKDAEMAAYYRILQERTAQQLQKIGGSDEQSIQQQILLEDCIQLSEDGWEQYTAAYQTITAQKITEEDKQQLPNRLRALLDSEKGDSEMERLHSALRSTVEFEAYIQQLREVNSAPNAKDRVNLQNAYQTLFTAAGEYAKAHRTEPEKLSFSFACMKAANQGFAAHDLKKETVREESEPQADAQKLLSLLKAGQGTAFGRQRSQTPEFRAVLQAMEFVCQTEKTIGEIQQRKEKLLPTMASTQILSYKKLENAANACLESNRSRGKANKNQLTYVRQASRLAEKELQKCGRDEERPFREEQKLSGRKSPLWEKFKSLSNALNESRQADTGEKKSPLFETMCLAAEKIAELERQQETLRELGQLPGEQIHRNQQAAYRNLETASLSYLNQSASGKKAGSESVNLAYQCRQLAKHGVRLYGRSEKALSATMAQEQKQWEAMQKASQEAPEQKAETQEKQNAEQRQNLEKNRKNIEALNEGIQRIRDTMKQMPGSGVKNILNLSVKAQTRMKNHMERGRMPYLGMVDDLKVMVIGQMAEQDLQKPEEAKAFSDTYMKVMSTGDPETMKMQIQKTKLNAFEQTMAYMWTETIPGKLTYEEQVVNTLVGEQKCAELAQICSQEKQAQRQAAQIAAQRQMQSSYIPDTITFSNPKK